MKNSREQWKYDFHRPSVMGGVDGKHITTHEVPVESAEPARYNDLKIAGTTTFQPSQTKGIVVKGEMAARRDAAEDQSKN
jgi:hypothetical protein